MCIASATIFFILFTICFLELKTIIVKLYNNNLAFRVNKVDPADNCVENGVQNEIGVFNSPVVFSRPFIDQELDHNIRHLMIDFVKSDD